MHTDTNKQEHAFKTNLVLEEFDIQNFTFNLMFIKSNVAEWNVITAHWGRAVETAQDIQWYYRLEAVHFYKVMKSDYTIEFAEIDCLC